MTTIPPITDPLGRNWEQPSASWILIDEIHAVMTRATFEALAEYSATNPTGCYPGKMWRRFDGAYDEAYLRSGGKPYWVLCWYGESERGPGWCSNNYRTILLSDGTL